MSCNKIYLISWIDFGYIILDIYITIIINDTLLNYNVMSLYICYF